MRVHSVELVRGSMGGQSDGLRKDALQPPVGRWSGGAGQGARRQCRVQRNLRQKSWGSLCWRQVVAESWLAAAKAGLLLQRPARLLLSLRMLNPDIGQQLLCCVAPLLLLLYQLGMIRRPARQLCWDAGLHQSTVRHLSSLLLRRLLSQGLLFCPLCW